MSSTNGVHAPLAPAPRDLEVGSAPATVALTVQLDPNRDTVAAWPE